MRVYHFTNAVHGLENIRKRRLKIAILGELNDPFEFASVDLSQEKQRDALKRTKATISQESGLLCFSKNWRNPVQWGHYSDRHRGICLGFDVGDKYLEQVVYVQSKQSWPDELTHQFMLKLLFTKFAHWSYEDEYRMWVELNEPNTAQEGELYFYGFSRDLVLREVIVGSESNVTRQEVAEALGELASTTAQFKARPAFKTFKVVRNKDEKLWK